jgi:hypothetical protein
MTRALALNITAVDRATKVIQDLNKRVSQMTRPYQNMQRSLQQFGRAAGFGVVKEKLEGLTRGAKRVAESFAKIGAPLIALVGGGTIAGLFALTAGWARFGLQVSQTARILGVNTQELYNFQNAARLVGISGQTATQSFQSFADTLQDARWGRNQQAMGLLVGLGIHLKNTKAGSIDAMDALGQIADKIHSFQQSGRSGAARTLANQLGLTSLLPVLMQGRKALEAYEAQAQKLSGAMNWQQAAAAAMQWNRLHIAMEGVKNTIGAALLPAVTPLVQQFGAWIQANRTLIATDLGDFVKGLGSAFRGLTLETVLNDILAIVKGMLSLVTDVASATASLGGLKDVLIAVGVLWGTPKIVSFGLAIWTMTGYVNASRKALLAWSVARAAATGSNTAGISAKLLAAPTAAGLLGATGIGLVGGAAVYGGAKWWEHHQLSKLNNSRIAASPMAGAVMRYFQSQGWTRTQAAGIAANIGAESGFNPGAVGDHGAARGIGQWHANRQAMFNSWALRNRLPGLRQADMLEQLQFYNYELRHSGAGKRLAGTTNAYDAGAAVSLYGERPADAAGQAAMRGDLAQRLAGSAAPPVNLSVQTTVHRDGTATTRVTTPSGVKIVNTSPTAGVT